MDNPSRTAWSPSAPENEHDNENDGSLALRPREGRWETQRRRLWSFAPRWYALRDLTKSTDALQLPMTIGRYQLLNAIASGGAATVYLARMLGKAGFQRRVAVKVLHRHLASDPEFVAGFLDEARLAARIHHPNVVDVYDVDAIKGRLIIVMEYVEGSSFSYMLTRLAKRMPRTPVGAVTKIVHDALTGLHAAHELTSSSGTPLALIHRDFSPQNVLIGVDGIVHVTDFGIAKARGRASTTQNHQVVKGKLRYLAPEQVQRGQLDRRVDIFAAGIMLWEALTGEPLFDAQVDAAVLGQVLSADIVPPGKIRSDVSAELDAVVMKALERQPDERYATAIDFAEALDDAVGEQFLRPRKLGALVQKLAAKRLDRARAAMMSVADNDDDRPSVAFLEELSSRDDAIHDGLVADVARDATTRPPGDSEPAPPSSLDEPTEDGEVIDADDLVNSVRPLPPPRNEPPAPPPARPSPPGAVVLDEATATEDEDHFWAPPSRRPVILAAAVSVALGFVGVVAFSGADDPPPEPKPSSSGLAPRSDNAPLVEPPDPEPSATTLADVAEPPAPEASAEPPSTVAKSTAPAPKPRKAPPATRKKKKIFIPGDI